MSGAERGPSRPVLCLPGPSGPAALAAETEGSGAAAPSAIAACRPPPAMAGEPVLLLLLPPPPALREQPRRASPPHFPAALSLQRSLRRALPSALSPRRSPPSLPPAVTSMPAPHRRTPAARPSLPRAGGSRLPAASTMLPGRGSPWPRGSRAVRTSPRLLSLLFRICGLNRPFPVLRAGVFWLGIISLGWGRGAGGCPGWHLRRGHLPGEQDRAGIHPWGAVFSLYR